MPEASHTPARSHVPGWVWGGSFLLGILLVLLGLPWLMASSLAEAFSWPPWPTYFAVLAFCYLVIPVVSRWFSTDDESRLRATACRMCRTVPGKKAVTKASGGPLLLICPKCGEVASMRAS